MDIDNIEFGNRLKTVLKKASLTQKEIAIKLNLSKNAINNYVQGRIPEAVILYKISCMLGVSIEWLLTGRENDNPTNENVSLVEAETKCVERIDKKEQSPKGFTQIILKEKELSIEADMLVRFYNEMSDDGKRELLKNASDLWAVHRKPIDNLSDSEESSCTEAMSNKLTS